MKKEINHKLKIYTTLSVLMMLFGLILMIYMIKVEDEPGALPLFLMVIGIVWFIVNRVKIKKQLQ
jgi:hypothetical protein